jgi:predicted dehydrogenase
MRFGIIGRGSMSKRRQRCLEVLGYDEYFTWDTMDDSKYDDVVTVLKPDALLVCSPPLTKQIYIDLANVLKIPCFCEADITEYTGTYYSSSTMRFHPAIQKIKELIGNGTLGKIYTFTHHCGNHIEDWHPGCDKKTYYAMKKETGGCKEILPFELSWLSYLFGSPIDCTGFIDKKLNDPDISADDVYSASVKFATVTGTMLVDIVSRPAIRELRVVCERGFIEWNWNDDYVFIRGTNEQNGIISFDKGTAAEGYNSNICEEMYQKELANWIAAIQGKEQYLFSREDEKAVMEMLRKVER